MTFEAFLDILGGRDLPLAMNIKADGLADAVKAALTRRRLTRWFVFDMSVPDTVHQFAARQPGVRPAERVRGRRARRWSTPRPGVWLDGFHGDWWTAEPSSNWTRLREGRVRGLPGTAQA